VLRNL